MTKKVLTLSVAEPWFSKIVSGTKIEEYREIKPYWAQRLIEGHDKGLWVSGEACFKPFTHVLIINGYGANRPRIEKEIKSITIGKPKKGLCPDKWLDKDFFVIKFK